MAVSDAPPPPRPRPGGRSARVVHDVLEATLEVMAERGYRGLSIEEVASRAGVNKSTVYRRWPTKPDLVRDALLRMSQSDPSPDSGSLRDDLLEFFGHRLARMSTPRGRSVASVVLLEGQDPELASVLTALKHERPSIPTAMIDRAIARGELPASIDRVLLTEALLSLYSRALWHNRPPSHLTLRRLLDLILTGARYGGCQRVTDETSARPAPSRSPRPGRNVRAPSRRAART